MDQLFDPDSLSAAMERGHVFERQASVGKLYRWLRLRAA